jgi:hypothetical protein
MQRRLRRIPRHRDHGPSRYTRINEAYELLDQGQTSRAIVLLQDVLREDPGNREARVMIASAYMGRAGIDVLSMHDAFRDVLFSKSLSDVFLKGGGKKDEPSPGDSVQVDPLTGAPRIDSKSGVKVSKVERMLEQVDEFLNNLRRVLVILDRFPKVVERRWPLMDEALSHLDRTGDNREMEREVRLYRMFVRLIYLKEVLVTRIVRDTSFGTRRWACTVELEDFHEGLTWVSATVALLSEDFRHVYPREAPPFERFEAMLKLFAEELGSLRESAVAGTETATASAQWELRDAFRCGAAGVDGKKPGADPS